MRLSWTDNDLRALLARARRRAKALRRQQQGNNVIVSPEGLRFSLNKVHDGMKLEDAIKKMPEVEGTEPLLDVEGTSAEVRERVRKAIRNLPENVTSAKGETVTICPPGSVHAKAEHWMSGKGGTAVSRDRAEVITRIAQTLQTAPLTVPGEPGNIIYVQRYADCGLHAVVVRNRQVTSQFVVTQFPVDPGSNVNKLPVTKSPAGLSQTEPSAGSTGSNPSPAGSVRKTIDTEASKVKPPDYRALADALHAAWTNDPKKPTTRAMVPTGLEARLRARAAALARGAAVPIADLLEGAGFNADPRSMVAGKGALMALAAEGKVQFTAGNWNTANARTRAWAVIVPRGASPMLHVQFVEQSQAAR